MTGPLVVLDIGQTLVDGHPRGPASRIAAATGLDVDGKRELHRLLMTTDYAGPADVAAVMRDRFGLAGPDVESAVLAIWTAQETEPEPIPGAVTALDTLVRRGYRLALLSNICTPYLTGVYRVLGDFFAAHIPPELRVFSCREGLTKPNVELFDLLLRRADTRPEDALMVGDSYKNDMAPALARGMRTLWLLHNPVRERAALVSILNGSAPAPSLTLPALADLDFDSPVLPRVLTGQAPSTGPASQPPWES